MPNTLTRPAAWRLTFAYQGGEVHLERKEKLTMVAPGSDPTEGYQGQTGYWVELRDAAGNVLYRVILHNPMPQYVEVHEKGGVHTHAAVRQRRGTFSVIVPALPQATAISFYGTDEPPVEPIGSRVMEQTRPATPRIGTNAAREMATSTLEATRP
jgi:hypothetical protein